MDAAEGDVEEEFGDEVAVADSVHAVLRHRGEAEFGGDEGAVEDDGGAGEGARAEGHDVEAFASVGEA